MSETLLNTHSDEALSRESRMGQLRLLLETLHTADAVANQGYFITSAELAALMDVNASAVTSRGGNLGVAQLDRFTGTPGGEPNPVAVGAY